MLPASMRSSVFEFAFLPIEAYMASTYGVRCARGPVPGGFFGDLNGAEIRLAERLDAEDSLFTLLHLFGHTVQWSLQGVVDLDVRPETLTEELVARVLRYEREACGYSMRLLLDAGFEGLAQWLSDFSAADLRHLLHFYATGEQRGAGPFWRPGEPRVVPLEIPPFEPKVLRWRWEGVVV
jgi:hypothetical protein